MTGKLGQFLRRDSYRLTIDLRSPCPSRQQSLVPIRGTFPTYSVVRAVGRCSFARRHHISFRCVIFGGLGSSLRRTGTLIYLLSGIPYEIGLVHFRTVPGISLRDSSLTEVRTFQSALGTTNVIYAVQTSQKRSVFTTYKVLSATGGRRGR